MALGDMKAQIKEKHENIKGIFMSGCFVFVQESIKVVINRIVIFL